MHFSNSEFVGDITSSSTAGAFKLQYWYLNPGLFDLCPWGASISNNFTQYQFTKLSFRYVPTSGNALNSTNTALGTVTCRFLADPTESLDENYGSMQNNYGSYRCAPTRGFSYPCSVSSSATNVQKTRSGVPPSGQDLRMYDLGIFEFASFGLQGTNTAIGQLYIDYEVRLMKPRIAGGFRGLTNLRAHFKSPACNWTNSDPFGTGSLALFPDGSLSSNPLIGYIPEYAPSVDGTVAASGPSGANIIFPRSDVGYRMMITCNWEGYGNPSVPVVLPTVSALSPPVAAGYSDVPVWVSDGTAPFPLWSIGAGGTSTGGDPLNLVQDLTFIGVVDVPAYQGRTQSWTVYGFVMPINNANSGTCHVTLTILPYNAE